MNKRKFLKLMGFTPFASFAAINGETTEKNHFEEEFSNMKFCEEKLYLYKKFRGTSSQDIIVDTENGRCFRNGRDMRVKKFNYYYNIERTNVNVFGPLQSLEEAMEGLKHPTVTLDYWV
tara:strand:+ start:51502 stop:51858 length:357 start_codon:yes stop_codon:yes gene_type:complete